MHGWWVGGTGVGIWLYDGLAARSMDDRGKMSPMGGELDGRTGRVVGRDSDRVGVHWNQTPVTASDATGRREATGSVWPVMGHTIAPGTHAIQSK